MLVIELSAPGKRIDGTRIVVDDKAPPLKYWLPRPAGNFDELFTSRRFTFKRTARLNDGAVVYELEDRDA